MTTLITVRVVRSRMSGGAEAVELEGLTISKQPRFDVLVRDAVRRCEAVLSGTDGDSEER